MRFIYFFALLALLATSVLAWEKEDHEIFDIVSELEASEGKGTTFYSWLDVPSTATTPEIARAYRKLSMQLHPDKNPNKKNAHERFARLGVISTILRNEESRKRYDFFYKNGVPKWRGTGYYYSRFRPGLGTVLVFLIFVTSGMQHIVQRMTYSTDLKRVQRIISDAKLQAWGPKMIPLEGEKRVKVNIGSPQYDEDGYPVPSNRQIMMVVRGQEVFIRNPDGSEEPVNESTASKPALSNTWFISLVKFAFSSAIGRFVPSKKGNDGDAYDGDVKEALEIDDTDDGSTSASETRSGTATPLEGRLAAVKAGGKRRKAVRKK
ncbi:hypothetical protein HGRIS_009532 [Hohenbuehelia grisea]|uniref:J domain-containing protein n=1 Tax=Hohenbuehelia grisea TaxID=104357 RepID=A0ABR3J1M0_9AGAR